MMKLTAVHHGYPTDTPATGYVAAGGQVRYTWDGHAWQPTPGRNTIAQHMGTLTDTQLRATIEPDLTTVLTLGGHWHGCDHRKNFAYYED